MEYPRTMDEAVKKVMVNMSEVDLKRLQETRLSDLIMYHHNLGTSIRNNFGLWENNYDLIENVSGSVKTHPDEVSMKIIEEIWLELNR